MRWQESSAWQGAHEQLINSTCFFSLNCTVWSGAPDGSLWGWRRAWAVAGPVGLHLPRGALAGAWGRVGRWVEFPEETPYNFLSLCLRNYCDKRIVFEKIIWQQIIHFPGEVRFLWTIRCPIFLSEILELDGGDDCTTLSVDWVPLNCTLKKGSTLYYLHFTTHKKHLFGWFYYKTSCSNNEASV